MLEGTNTFLSKEEITVAGPGARGLGDVPTREVSHKFTIPLLVYIKTTVGGLFSPLQVRLATYCCGLEIDQ